MKDIMKCNGSGCAVRMWCWRFRAPDSEHQSYAAFDEKVKLTGGRCIDFWPMSEQETEWQTN